MLELVLDVDEPELVDIKTEDEVVRDNELLDVVVTEDMSDDVNETNVYRRGIVSSGSITNLILR